MGDPIDEVSVASLLSVATTPRFRRNDGRFGSWESRPAPSAGGMAAIRLLVLPIDPAASGGLYDEDSGTLLLGEGMETALSLNIESVLLLASGSHGTTIQLAADYRCYRSCYGNPDSVLWRDAGVLCATLVLVATSLSLRSVILGRVGDDVVRASGMDDGWCGAGAVHVSA